jgi:hypothetical protein
MHHRLYQQAITMLQENMITFFLEQEKLGWSVKTNRDAVSNAIRITCIKKRTVDDEKPEAELIHRLLNNPLIKTFAPDLEALSMLRNDVNHGGYRTEEDNSANSAKSILDQFNSIWKRIREKLSTMES